MIRPSLCSSVALALVAGLVSAGCSDSNDPSKITGQEVLVAVNSTAASLSVVPVDSLGKGFTIPLGGTNPTPIGVSVRGATALVPLGDDNAVAVVDLRTRQVRLVPLAAGSGATGSAIVDDSIAYVANPNLNTVTRVNYVTGDTASLPAGRYPQGVIAAKGRVYVLAGNLESFAPAGPSALIVIDPKTNTRLAGADSIPLSGPGNAGFGDVDADGLLYVMSTGSYGAGTGRLSIVDPSSRAEVATADDFGNAPGPIAYDRTSRRLFVSSYAEGLMVWDAKSRTMVRGAGHGLTVPSNAGVAVDGEGRIYALETGACAGGEPGMAHVFNAELTEVATVNLGECPVGAAVTKIPD